MTAQIILLEPTVFNLLPGTSTGTWCNVCVVGVALHPKRFTCLEIHDLNCRISYSALIRHKFGAFLAFNDIFILNI
jgi:hypothetical protein